ncbi:ThiF family adenylyltransferase [Bailinhaonella thermotolerans]|uniref:THIF-type NAD/FAD binding fold domain-containing protein n=1 Tax=Bailinhaonella thermotolerans TaxID=1070861 RepID=A0A3A4A8Y5_9ACTN|nr:ThiF family adenylyltransferase [Bailinhaonella thermotolerans]RJL21712.1 hypothetical protein D5H75_36870 [Bailinhaonella thermotolerans]
MDLESFAESLAAPAVPPHLSWRPELVRPEPGERDALTRLCAAHGLTVVDTIERQAAELAAVRLPGASAAERARYAAGVLGERPEAYGTWVHLPWKARVVHVLAPEDYTAVVTARNQLKITAAEQRVLARKRIGVIGLSVGGEAAVTLAQEHLCGRIALADHDALDLSNLNRLGAGVDDLGLPKTRLAARRIALLDPYLEVELHEDGVTPGNAAAFLDGLDLLVEECDGLAVKHLVRELARDRGLDVVYAADERGFLSVEPYSAHPGLALFHGLADGAAARGPYLDGLVAWLGGADALSERSRRSLGLIGRDLSGYPQLAGEARFAAGLLAHVARRLLLGEPVPPFHGHLDLAELLPGT